MGLDRSGSACGNLARSDTQHGGYASRKTLHPRIGSANPHADRNPYSDAHPHTNGNPNAHANTNANIDSFTIRADYDAGDWYSIVEDIE